MECLEQARIHWSTDGWKTVSDSDTVATGLGLHVLDLPPQRLTDGTIVRFTMFWPAQNRWEGTDFQVRIARMS